MNVWDLPIEDKERLRGQKVILSMSGGKDSTAAALLLERHSIDFTSVFMDTGWEHPATYEYVDQVLLPRFGNIVKVSASFPDPDNEGQFVALIRKKGIFPSRLTRFCTTELKMKPFKKFLVRWQSVMPNGRVDIPVLSALVTARGTMHPWHLLNW